MPDHLFGFVAQQSLEKLLKALITAHQRRYPFTHSLADLLKLVADLGEAFPQTPFVLVDLDPYAVEFRYNFGNPFSDDERILIRQSLAVVREHILTRILAIEAAAPTP